jgi:uncharacterized protein (UPF0332 family)
MDKKINYIIREVPPEHTEFNYYFDDDGLTAAGGDYCYNLFIVTQSRNSSGFNEKEYQNIQTEIENLLEMYADIVNKSNYAQYSSVGAMLLDYKLIDSIHNTKRIKAFTDYFKMCCEKPISPYANYHDNFTAYNEEMTAQYLTLKTGKQWTTDSAHGYCQGDYVEMVYCSEHYKDGVKHYGEIWLGAGKEFYTIELDENGEEVGTCGGYIIADCQVRNDEDYKRLVCEWACIPEDETRLEMIDSYKTVTQYTYRAV